MPSRRQSTTPSERLSAMALLLCSLVFGACASGGASVDTEVALEVEAEDAASESPIERSEAEPSPADVDEAPRCQAQAIEAPRWYDDAVGYEIFVRSFKDSDGDGVGDLKGLTEMLDYLNDGDPETTQDLGVDLLWLMPIHQSPSYHGYDVSDYDRVDDEYGTEEDLDAMLEAAEARGIRVIIDLVMNHSSSEHPWFLDAKTGPNATYRNFYVWSESDLGWTQPWGSHGTWHPTPTGYYYGLFWGGMPDLNFQSETVKATMTQIATNWLGRGIAGYRLDAVRYLVETGGGDGQKDTEETLDYWRRLREATDAVNDQALLLGEAWADSSIVSSYFGEATKPSMHMAFDFDTASALEGALVSGYAPSLRAALCARLEGWPTHGRAGSFATNHDMRRLASRLKVAGAGALHLLAVALMTLPGTPWIYYGQELGLENGPTNDDIDKRLPMQWDEGPGVGFTEGTAWAAPKSTSLAQSVAGQSDDPESLLSRYRDLIALRRAHPALRHGATRMLSPEAEAGAPALAFIRSTDSERIFVALNLSQEVTSIRFPEDELAELEGLSPLYGHMNARPEASRNLSEGLTLPAFGALVMRTEASQ